MTWYKGPQIVGSEGLAVFTFVYEKELARTLST